MEYVFGICGNVIVCEFGLCWWNVFVRTYDYLWLCIVFLKKKKKKKKRRLFIVSRNDYEILSISFVILVNIICIINNVQILIDIDIDMEYMWVTINLTSNVSCCRISNWIWILFELNSIKTGCKNFDLHQLIRTCHIRFLIKINIS